MVPYESSLERDLCYLLEFDRAVRCYEAQPVEIRYERPDGRRVRGFPDFRVVFSAESGRSAEILDVKYRAEIRERWAELKPRFRAACRYARERGEIYRLQTDTEIRVPSLVRAKFLYRYLNTPPDERALVAFRTTLHAHRRTTPEALLQLCFSRDAERAGALPTLWSMVANGAIGADPERPLTMQSLLWLVG
jgi:hypothetical protein